MAIPLSIGALVKTIGVSIAVAAAALLLLTGCAAPAASAAGTWGTPNSSGQGEPGLNLADDGKVTGNDGCNRLMGEWTETDGTVEFGALASTMMFCEGVDTWLLGASTAEVDGDSLVVFNEAGDQIGTLPRG
ncbi:META domain-containing protein [Pseudoclavibacter sp. RFBB5]|uniref:META domain-containing protein n=1 Tax=Pseudoclavibacter sp. RFBB5 TaxID=2080574 RepID=UPI00215746F1|nr:META domain-containing protein [Pseudoclavibacter sp. RFBB5]